MTSVLIFLFFQLNKLYVYSISLYIYLLPKYVLYFEPIFSWDSAVANVYIYIYIVLLLSSISMLMTKNPIYSVFYLILVFIHVGFLLLMVNVEFLAFLLFIVYLGAIAVLFLFVIMMFNIQILESRDNIVRYLPLVLVIILVILEMCYVGDFLNFNSIFFDFTGKNYVHKTWYTLLNNKESIVVLSIIYNYYFFNFFLASFILLAGMFGAIVLTLQPTINLKKQVYYKQNAKTLQNSLKVKAFEQRTALELWEVFKRK